ncbi:MAG: DUF1016 N-terminal domain-containing protein [Gemmatimonadota bacterium]|nr:DUF1016 N-terminal domain-containing protein [Gemmatimonadota bacterium]
MTDTIKSADYVAWLNGLKSRIQSAHLSAARSINREMILLYWDIGHGIVEKQAELGWGDSVIERLASDLSKVFPSLRGFSQQNIWRMKQLYSIYSSPEFLSQVVRELEQGSTGQEIIAELPAINGSDKIKQRYCHN